MIHRGKNKMKREEIPKKIIQSVLGFAASLPIFLFVIGHLVPHSISFINVFFFDFIGSILFCQVVNCINLPCFAQRDN